MPDLAHTPADAARDLRFSRKIARLHPLGPRVQLELLREIGKAHGIGDYIERRVDRYLEVLTPEALACTGGDRLPPVPIHSVHEAGR